MKSIFLDDDSLVLYVKHFTPLGSVLYDMEKDLNFIIHELIKLEPIYEIFCNSDNAYENFDSIMKIHPQAIADAISIYYNSKFFNNEIQFFFKLYIYVSTRYKNITHNLSYNLHTNLLHMRN